MKVLMVNPDKCTGCRACQLACSMKKTGEYNPSAAGIYVFNYVEQDCFPVMCFRCEKPYCARACSVGAITKDAITGVMRIYGELCFSCTDRQCIPACPWHCLTFSTRVKKAISCDLCDGEPECINFCATGALEFKEENAAAAMALKKRVAKAKKNQVAEKT